MARRSRKEGMELYDLRERESRNHLDDYPNIRADENNWSLCGFGSRFFVLFNTLVLVGLLAYTGYYEYKASQSSTTCEAMQKSLDELELDIKNYENFNATKYPIMVERIETIEKRIVNYTESDDEPKESDSGNQVNGLFVLEGTLLFDAEASGNSTRRRTLLSNPSCPSTCDASSTKDCTALDNIVRTIWPLAAASGCSVQYNENQSLWRLAIDFREELGNDVQDLGKAARVLEEMKKKGKDADILDKAMKEVEKVQSFSTLTCNGASSTVELKTKEVTRAPSTPSTVVATGAPSITSSLAPTNTPYTNKTQTPSSTTYSPTQSPSNHPTSTPTSSPSNSPSNSPTLSPSHMTYNPSVNPSLTPTLQTRTPSLSPSPNPTAAPTNQTTNPSLSPSLTPTIAPTNQTSNPSLSPSLSPSTSPSFMTYSPSPGPSLSPSTSPSMTPTQTTNNPSATPSASPSIAPTQTPTKTPTIPSSSPTSSTRSPTSPTRSPTSPTRSPTRPTLSPTRRRRRPCCVYFGANLRGAAERPTLYILNVTTSDEGALSSGDKIFVTTSGTKGAAFEDNFRFSEVRIVSGNDNCNATAVTGTASGTTIVFTVELGGDACSIPALTPISMHLIGTGRLNGDVSNSGESVFYTISTSADPDLGETDILAGWTVDVPADWIIYPTG